jgi:gamma-glutamylcyclotransferase (GGCT)/AIG2-like uncharacterized protein YtfP
MPHFECGAFDHSATSPRGRRTGHFAGTGDRQVGRAYGIDGRAPATSSGALKLPQPVTPLFVYGTLRHSALLAAVLGHPIGPETMLPAVAPRHRAAVYPGRIYPALTPAAGGEAVGLLLTALSAFDRDVLDAFEGDEYRRAPIEVIVGGIAIKADGYWPMLAIPEATPDWSYAAWLAEHADAMILNDRANAALLRERLIARGSQPGDN